MLWLLQNVTVLVFPQPSISVNISDVEECDGFSVFIDIYTIKEFGCCYLCRV